MKSTGNLRGVTEPIGPEDALRKAAKLPPLKKSGKEKHAMYRELEEEDEDLDLKALRKHESILDYYDDGEDTEDEWEEEDEDDADDLDEDWEEDWTENEEEEDWEE